MKKKNKANYGQEMAVLLKTMSILTLVLIICGIWLPISLVYSITLYSISGLFAVLVFVGVWSSRVGKLLLRDKIFSKLKLKGDETVLDIGCGRGLLLIRAAKNLTSGKAIGADHWQGTMEYSYTSEMVKENASIEGVENQIEIMNADAQALPFENDKFDIVMTSLMMHHVPDTSKAISEMIRVLKPQGALIFADVGAHRFIDELKIAGIIDIQIEQSVRLFFMPVKIIRGRKSISLQLKLLNKE
jgi:arsenite methyltransferase